MKSVMSQVLTNWEDDLTNERLKTWQDKVDSKIEDLYRDWEGRMPDDTTLYTLGLRHAQDLIRGKDVETS